MSMEELLSRADVLSILCPLTETTHHLISYPVRIPGWPRPPFVGLILRVAAIHRSLPR